MQKCGYCGDNLPENSRFCGKCGNVQNAIATDAAPTRINTPQPQFWAPEDGTIAATWAPYSNYPAQGNMPAWSPNVQAPGTPPRPPIAENKDEDRRGIPPWFPLYGAALGGDALLGSGQTYTPGAPGVQGTPQIGNAPSVAGSPTSYTNAPVGHPVQGLGNAPVSHPIQGPVNAPIRNPVQRPQPTHHPPQQPGTQKHHPPHKPHEPHRHHTHPIQHELHAVAHKTKGAGGLAAKAIIIVVTTVVVAAGAIGAAAYFLLRPQPLISITSSYKVGNVLAGARGTILHISGQKFSSNSAITFLLDGHVAPGTPSTRSDSNGNFSTDVTITAAWSIGTHTLTATDASNYSTKNSVSVTIVQAGQANTPGPNGAPSDDASFKVIAQIQRQATAGNPYSGQETEVVTGHPDPMGGTVCQTEDNGQPIVTTGFTINSHIPVQKTDTFSCTGSYKGGKLTLTEMVTSEVSVYSQPDGTTATCTLNSPQPDEQVSGSYTGNNTFSGTITYLAIPASDFSCVSSNGFYNFYPYEQANWTGQVTDLHR